MSENATLPVFITETSLGMWFTLDEDSQRNVPSPAEPQGWTGPFPTNDEMVIAINEEIAKALAGALEAQLFS